MRIAKNLFVELHYTLKEGGPPGELIESTVGDQPLSFVFGTGQMIPAFEDQLEGKSAGEQCSFLLEAEEAYGLYDDDAIISLPMSSFEVDGVVDQEQIAIGEPLSLRDQEGNTFQGIITETTQEHVTVDMNHPMAGIDLHFDVEIVAVREAQEDELPPIDVYE